MRKSRPHAAAWRAGCLRRRSRRFPLHNATRGGPRASVMATHARAPRLLAPQNAPGAEKAGRGGVAAPCKHSFPSTVQFGRLRFCARARNAAAAAAPSRRAPRNPWRTCKRGGERAADRPRRALVGQLFAVKQCVEALPHRLRRQRTDLPRRAFRLRRRRAGRRARRSAGAAVRRPRASRHLRLRRVARSVVHRCARRADSHQRRHKRAQRVQKRLARGADGCQLSGLP